MGHFPGLGLGKKEQGVTKVKGNLSYRLGYVPTEEDKAAEVDGRKREEGLAPYPKTLIQRRKWVSHNQLEVG